MINKHYLDCLTPTYMYKLKSVLIQILSRSFETYKLWWALEYPHLDPIWMIWHTHITGRTSECPHTDPIWMIWHTYYRMSPIISSLISYLKNLTNIPGWARWCLHPPDVPLGNPPGIPETPSAPDSGSDWTPPLHS